MIRWSSKMRVLRQQLAWAIGGEWSVMVTPEQAELLVKMMDNYIARLQTRRNMTDEEIVELMAEGAHEAWVEGYLADGVTSRTAVWGEEFMVPYDQLSERGKELDRRIMRGILPRLRRAGVMP